MLFIRQALKTMTNITGESRQRGSKSHDRKALINHQYQEGERKLYEVSRNNF